MKFYEFNKHEYYALIVAEDSEKAKLGYEEFVADLDDEEKSLQLDEITPTEALGKYLKTAEPYTDVEKEKKFNKEIDYYKKHYKKIEYLPLLIDGTLI